MTAVIVRSKSTEDSLRLARLIGSLLRPGDVVALWGELGAGKTLMAGGIARALGVPPDVPVTSPTFTFINEYEGSLHFYHLDLYRLSHPDELETLPWREALYGEGAAAVEWPDRLGEALPEERWDIQLAIMDEHSRDIRVRPPRPEAFRELSNRLKNEGLTWEADA